MSDVPTSNVSDQICRERMHHLEDRIDKLEQITEQIRDLALSVNRLAIQIENMTSVQAKQEERVLAIEKHEGDKWRMVVKYTISAVVGIVIGFALKNLGF